MASTTRIADLPENITMSVHPPVQQGPGFAQSPGFPQMQGQGSLPGGIPSMNTRQQPEEHNPVYTQMNVHPNPYGNPQQPQMMPIPQQTQVDYSPQYRLPSRDIPRETDMYMQDEAIQPNYIPPPPKLTSDYIRDYADEVDADVRSHKQKKHKERMMDTFLTEFQIPIFVAILFFIFQMPAVNTLLYKRFSFLSIYGADGNFNFYGLFLKSAAFGSAYYSLSRIIEYLSSI
jgi:hypothetical protein